MKSSIYIYLFILFITISCSKSSTQDDVDGLSLTLNYEWTVPLKDIVGSFNPFPFAENPTMSTVSNVEGLNDESTVVIVSFNDKVNIYPLTFVQPFETVNDNLSNTHFTISYCPITQSTLAINRKLGSDNLTFRASGILYKENLVMHDANSDSFWSQMLLKSIKGPFENETLKTFPLIETSWKTAKTYFPNANVFTNKSIVSSKNSTLQKSTDNITSNEKVFGFIDNLNNKVSDVFIYRYSQFENGIKLYNSGFSTKKIVIGSSELKFITSFFNDENYIFKPIQNEFPIVMSDQLGNNWDAFGLAISGPNKGKQLIPATGFIAAWWAWQDFYTSFTFVE